MNEKNNFKYSIQIPVPIGEKVWTFWTCCCDACLFQYRKNHPLECDGDSPCHTKVHSVYAVEMTYERLAEVLRDWEKKYFYTEQEAKEAANEFVRKHIQEMRELGYDIDDDGNADNKSTRKDT